MNKFLNHEKWIDDEKMSLDRTNVEKEPFNQAGEIKKRGKWIKTGNTMGLMKKV